ncbi:MAG: nucleotidyltransferase family protein [Terriglobales bacterium]
MDKRSCAAIILAAGSSTRLGKPKQLIQIEGTSLLKRTAILALDAGCSPVVAVLGADAEQLEPELDGLDVRIARNHGWASGMASSLNCGVKMALSLDAAIAKVLILVCDQPKLDSRILINLLEKHERSGAAITASSYAGTRGVPAIFSKEVFPALGALRGDEGARRIIATYQGRVEYVDFPGGADDIDTVEDLWKTGQS